MHSARICISCEVCFRIIVLILFRGNAPCAIIIHFKVLFVIDIHITSLSPSFAHFKSWIFLLFLATRKSLVKSHLIYEYIQKERRRRKKKRFKPIKLVIGIMVIQLILSFPMCAFDTRRNGKTFAPLHYLTSS